MEGSALPEPDLSGPVDKALGIKGLGFRVEGRKKEKTAASLLQQSVGLLFLARYFLHESLVGSLGMRWVDLLYHCQGPMGVWLRLPT